MEINGTQRELNVNQGNSMNSMGINRSQPNSIEINANQQTKGNQRKLVEIHRLNTRKSTDMYGNQRKSPEITKVNGNRRKSMEINRNHWKSMEIDRINKNHKKSTYIDENRQKSTEIHGNQQNRNQIPEP